MFKTVFAFEFKKLFNKRNVLIFLVILLVLIVFSWEGIDEYKTTLKNRKPFLETEKAKTSRFLNYTQYGTRGVRLLLIPAPLSVIFNDLAIYSGLVANIDTGEGLYIYNTFKGKNLFANSGGYMDYSGIIFFISCFLALIYGYDITRKREYLKFMANTFGYKRTHFLIILSRTILLNLALLLICGITLLWLLINGINSVNSFFLCFVLVLILLVTFFLLIGSNIGRIKNKSVKFITLVSVYCLFLVLIPWVIKKAVYVEAKNNMNSNYMLEFKKFGMLMNFEDRFDEKFGIWKSGKEAPGDVKAMIQSGQEKEYKEIYKYEMEMLNAIKKRVKVYQTLCALFPTSFYLSCNRELSGSGFQTFIDFYSHVFKTKYEFIDFFVVHKFHKPLTNEGVKVFLKEGKNLFFAKSHILNQFLLGIGLMLFYIAVLYILSFRGYKKQIEEEPGELKDLGIDIKPGKFNYMVTGDQGLKNQVFNFLSGRGKTFVNISLDGKPLESKSFVYLFDTRKMPEDITPRILHKFLLGKELIDDKPNWKILFEYAVSQGKEGKVIVMDCFLSGLKPEEIKQLKGRIVMNGLKSLYISANWDQAVNLADDKIIFHRDDNTVGIIESRDLYD